MKGEEMGDVCHNRQRRRLLYASAPGCEAESLINEADRALYLAKANAGTCQLFDPNDPNNSDDTENVAALLNIAIAQNLVSLFISLIKTLSTDRAIGLEALMRCGFWTAHLFLPASSFPSPNGPG